MFQRITKSPSVFAFLLCASNAAAQSCPLGWAKGPLIEDMRGADGQVRVMVEYDPPGALPPQLVVAGGFSHIGSIAANHIAAWDGNIWKPLGVGTDGPVLALRVVNNNLIVAGNFDQAGGLGPNSKNIAAWNGSDWFMLSPNPLAVPNDNSYPLEQASTLASYNGQLIVGGRFTMTSGDATVALLNGTVWQRLSLDDFTDEPEVLQTFDADGAGPALPYLYCDSGDGENSWVRWNGSTWQSFFPHPTGFPHGSMVTNDGLVTFGSFTAIDLGDNDWNEDVRRMSIFDGSEWHEYGSGVGSSEWTWNERILAVRQFGNDLYVAGHFSEAGGLPCVNMARWNGSNWFPTGNFFSGKGYTDVHDLRVFGSQLIAGGNFNLSDSLGEVNNLAKFDGQFWKAFTMPVRVNALGTIGSGWLVLGGTFAQPYDEEQPKTLQHLAIWNGLELAPLDSGVNGPVHTIKSYTVGGENRLIVGGEFTLVGSDPGSDPGIAGSAISANRIALWSQPLLFGGGWEPMGEGFNGNVLAVEWLPANQFFGDVTFAAGEFTAAGGGSPTFNRIASWSGSPAQWFTMGTGFNGTVRALKGFNNGVLNRFLYAGGDFTTASGVSANHIAYFPMPNLNGWVAMGNGFNAPVHAIERHNGSIYAAGEFTMSGSTPISHVARWTGTAWEGVGQGINGNVYALKSHDGKLFATGGFAFLVWDGTTWAAVDGALTLGSGRAIQPFRTEIEVGGDFIAAGGEVNGIDTSGLARFRYQGLPWIVHQPTAQTATCHFDVVNFDVDICTEYQGLVTYQWHKNGVPLTEGWDRSGSYRLGTTFAHMEVIDPSDADEGAYHLVISNECGTVTSVAASLTVNGTCAPCPMDVSPLYAGNGVIDVDDLLLVVNSWGSCTSAPFQCRADVAPPSGNGIVDVDDLLALINAWGSCP